MISYADLVKDVVTRRNIQQKNAGNRRRGKKQPPSLRRHYPVQVLRVSSQPLHPPKAERVSTPGTLENRFSAGYTNISNRQNFSCVKKIYPCNIFRVCLSLHHQLKIIHMKKIIFASLAIFSLLAGYSQSDDKNLQTRKVTGFTGVDVSGGIDLYLSSGAESVSVSASTTIVRDHMVTEVVDGLLRIHLEKNWNPGPGNPKMKAYVSMRDVKSLEASGGGDIYLKNMISTNDLNVHLSGGGNIEGKLNADHLNIKQSGGSNVSLTGNVKDLNVDASGGGNLKGYDLVTDIASINASGGSDAELTVNKELRVKSSGGSDVSYKGKAVVISIKSSGGGSLTHKD
jgi:hypothetical protein